MKLKKGLKPWSLVSQSALKRLPHSTYRSKKPASTKHHRINIWELTLTQHWHWMTASNQNTKSSVPDYRLLSKLLPNLNGKASKMIYANIAIPVSAYCGTVNLNLLRKNLENLIEFMNKLLVSSPKLVQWSYLQ